MNQIFLLSHTDIQNLKSNVLDRPIHFQVYWINYFHIFDNRLLNESLLLLQQHS